MASLEAVDVSSDGVSLLDGSFEPVPDVSLGWVVVLTLLLKENFCRGCSSILVFCSWSVRSFTALENIRMDFSQMEEVRLRTSL